MKKEFTSEKHSFIARFIGIFMFLRVILLRASQPEGILESLSVSLSITLN